jgi:hypothetical protein
MCDDFFTNPFTLVYDLRLQQGKIFWARTNLQNFARVLKLNMCPYTKHVNRPTVFVIGGVYNKLVIGR